MGDVKNIPIHFISAKTNFGLNSLMDSVLKVYEKWNIRISTGMLNDWLNRFKKLHPLPAEGKE